MHRAFTEGLSRQVFPGHLYRPFSMDFSSLLSFKASRMLAAGKERQRELSLYKGATFSSLVS